MNFTYSIKCLLAVFIFEIKTFSESVQRPYELVPRNSRVLFDMGVFLDYSVKYSNIEVMDAMQLTAFFSIHRILDKIRGSDSKEEELLNLILNEHFITQLDTFYETLYFDIYRSNEIHNYKEFFRFMTHAQKSYQNICSLFINSVYEFSLQEKQCQSEDLGSSHKDQSIFAETYDNTDNPNVFLLCKNLHNLIKDAHRETVSNLRKKNSETRLANLGYWDDVSFTDILNVLEESANLDRNLFNEIVETWAILLLTLKNEIYKDWCKFVL